MSTVSSSFKRTANNPRRFDKPWQFQRFSLTCALRRIFLPTAKCVFGGCQSSVSMTIQERALNEKQFGSKLSAEWNNEKILREALTTLWRFCVFLTDSKIWQTLNYYLKSTKNKSLGKGLFIESMNAQMHWKHLKIRNANLFSRK